MSELESLKDKIDNTVYNRARHVISEISRCEKSSSALESKDYLLLGKLMVASHNSLRDDYEVSCEELDLLVKIATQQKGI
jgi:galactokinase